MLTIRTDEYVVDVDKYINKMATTLHTRLLAYWELDTAEYRAYGRCYKIPSITGDGFIPAVFKEGVSSKDYKPVAANDKVTCTSFFGVGDTITYRNQNTVPVHLIFSVNLQRLWEVGFRADADVRRDVQNIVHNRHGFNITSMETGIDRVYAEYTSRSLREKLKTIDMQPYHTFRINFDLAYLINNDCVKKKSRPGVRIFDDPFDDTFE